MSLKLLIGTTIFTLVVDIFCFISLLKYDVATLFRTLTSSEVTVEFTHLGKGGKNLPFKISFGKVDFFSHVCQDGKGQCANLELPITYQWKKEYISLSAVGKGEFSLKTVHSIKRGGGRILVDFRNVRLNGKFTSFDKVLSLDTDYLIRQKAIGGISELSFEVRQHHFRSRDLKVPISIWFVVTGNIIIFLLAYRIFVLLIKIKEVNRIDAFFVTLFFVFLFVPMGHVSRETVSKQENRALAMKPSLKNFFVADSDYGKNFEKWFSDHFYGRKQFIDLHSAIVSFNQFVENGKNGFVFNKSSRWVVEKQIFTHKPLPSKLDKQVLSSLEMVQKFCKENKIDFYMVIVPHRLDVYPNEMQFYRRSTNHNKLFASTISFIQKNATFPVIYPLKTLEDATKKDFVYFKTEHHWTEWGAFLAYKEIVQAIQKDFKLEMVDEKNFNVFYDDRVRGDWDRRFGLGETYDALGIKIPKQELLDTKYKYYEPKIVLQNRFSEEALQKDFSNSQNKTKIRAILIGDSFCENLLQFLPFSFKELRYYRLNNFGRLGAIKWSEVFKLLKRYKRNVLNYKPNVLILCISAGNLPNLVNLDKD